MEKPFYGESSQTPLKDIKKSYINGEMYSVRVRKGNRVRKPIFLSVHYKFNTFRSKSLRDFPTDFNKKIGKFIQKNNGPQSSQNNSEMIHRKEFTLTDIST